MKALFPPPGHQQRAPPKTAGTKVRPNKQQKKHNSLNLHVPIGQDSQKRMQQANMQQQNVLLNRLDQNKYMTEKDAQQEALKEDESKRRQWLEQQNYQLFSDGIIGDAQEDSMSGAM